jgi:hypothetical protein
MFVLGIEVYCLINDQGSNFIQLMSLLGVTREHPYFEVNSRKFFAMCHLIKSLRDNLIKYCYNFDGKIASWEHLRLLYSDLKRRNLCLSPKLTDKHIAPTNFQKMSVRLATQVFSHTVSAAMETYIAFGMLPAAAIGTAHLFATINNFFDLFNSSRLKGPSCLQSAFTKASVQLQLLQECKHLFENLTVNTY